MRFVRSLMLAALALVAGGAPAQDRMSVPSALRPAPTAPAVIVPAAPPSPAAGQRELTKADLDTWLDGFLPYALRSGDIPGAVVTVVKDGRILTARGFGYADVAKRAPVDPARTLFRPGSISKLFTWTAVMQQVERGRIDLDADVNRYLDFRIPARDGQPVTMRQLMTHTGGFEEQAKGIIFYDRTYDLPLGEYLKRWVPTRIFAAGTTPAYSNWGTALAAYVVQRTSGEDFDTYLERNIFAPLGMRYSTFRQPLPPQLARYMSQGYPVPGQGAKGFEYIGPGPAGEGSMSGTDMARFMLAHLGDGAIDGRRILLPATARTMHNSPLDRVDPKSLIPPLNRMHLGFFETNVNGRQVIGHLGDTSAFHSSLHLFMREGVGLYVSFNSAGKAAAVQPLRTALFQDFADRYFPNVAPADGRVDAKTAAQHAQMMAGTWWASRRAESSWLSIAYLLGQADVGVGADGQLVIPAVKGANGRPREWVEIAPFVWRDRYGHDRLAAQVVDGQVVRWSFDFASPFMVFDRVPAGKSKSWIMPALYLSLAVLLLTFLSWPIAKLIRRTYKAAHPLTGRALRASRATKLMAGLTVGLLVGWIALTAVLESPDALAGGLDPVLMALQIAGAVIFVGAVLVSGWNLWLTWTDGRRWTRKLWALLIFLAALLVLYVATRFGLIACSVDY
jgi:CubicO group peptidase (beta-lactamase class C family)